MFCKYCGYELTENASFCPACGKAVADYNQPAQEPVREVFVDEPQTPAYNDEERDRAGRSILTFSILSVAFSSTLFLGLLGLIFAIVSKSKVNSYLATYGETRGVASVGKGIGIGALILGIFMTVFASLYFFIIFVAILAGI